MTPTPTPALADTVFLIADSRLDSLRGQTLLIGTCLLAIPAEPGPFPVPVEAAVALVKQAGWRLADPRDAAVLASAPPPAAPPVIGNPQRTRDEIGRVSTAQVASPSAAEMSFRERRQRPPEELGVLPVALAMAGMAAAGIEVEELPSAPATDASAAEPLASDLAAVDPSPSSSFDAGDSDFGGSSDPLD